MRLFSAVLVTAYANSMLQRQEKIIGHLNRLAEMSLDMESKKDARHVAKVQKWVGRVVDANDRDGEKCDGIATVDAADDLNVFDDNDPFKLNSQIMSALRSFARKYACNGRGNVPRQITRRSRRLEENFERRKSWITAPETTTTSTITTTTTTTTEAPTTTVVVTTTEAPREPPTEPQVDSVIYLKSDETMTYSEAISYCYEQGMELASLPTRWKNSLGYNLLHSSISSDMEWTDEDQQAWIQDPYFCAIISFHKFYIQKDNIGFLDDNSQVIYPSYPNRCDSQFKAICMTGEYQTTSPVPTTTTDFVY